LRHGGLFSLLAAAAACSIDDRVVTFDPDAGSGAEAGSEAGGAGGESGNGAGGEAANCRADVPATELCVPTPPESALITDFSDAMPILDDECNPGVSFAVDSVPGGGQSYVYDSFELALPEASLKGEEPGERALHIVATPGVPVSADQSVIGFGLGWLGCVDASAYEGVTFTLRGTMGTCVMLPGIMISQNTIVRLNAAGSCLYEMRCAPPRSAPITAEGTYRLRFADFSGGFPLDGVDTARILGLNLLLFVPLEGPPCQIDLVLDDVGFF
jgi:hypothetical protein